jgi:uncharacterized protein (TIGR03118 family)
MQMQPISRRLASIVFVLLVATGTTRGGDAYNEFNLVSNIPGMAQQTDPNLLNPWGVSFSTGSPLWVSNQLSGTATVYSLSGVTSSPTDLTIGIPNLGGAPASTTDGPTGQVSTGALGITTPSTDFQVSGGKANFIFANMDGSISAWRGGAGLTSSVIEASVSTASFTGLAIGMVGASPQIYAADQNSNNVYIFNGSWAKIGSLTDPSIPTGFNAFNVQNIGGILYVTYANPNSPTGGFVDEYATGGTLIKQLISDPLGTSGSGHLDTPWGLAIAPSGWGKFGGDLLVGNNDGDGAINAYTLGGVWQGQIMTSSGLFSPGELWAISFGNGGGAGSPSVLYFAAGLPGQTNGLIGAISVVPEPSSLVMGLIAAGMLAGGWMFKDRQRRTAA